MIAYFVHPKTGKVLQACDVGPSMVIAIPTLGEREEYTLEGHLFRATDGREVLVYAQTKDMARYSLRMIR